MDSQPHTPNSVGLARIFWMLLGPFALVLLGLSIVSRGESWATPADFAFLAVVMLLPYARWYEFRHGHAETSTGEPATPAHLTRYCVLAVIIGAAAWATANVLGVHLFAR